MSDSSALLASWVAAGGTVAAVALTAAIAWGSARGRARTQAGHVSAWTGLNDQRAAKLTTSSPPECIVVSNGSDSAIYDVLIARAGAWGSMPADRPHWRTQWITSIAPGDWVFGGFDYDGESMDVRWGVLIGFRDGNGRRWIRTARGQLRRQWRGNTAGSFGRWPDKADGLSGLRL